MTTPVIDKFPLQTPSLSGSPSSFTFNPQLTWSIPAFGSFTYQVDVGLTVDIQITLDDPASATAQWVTVVAGATGGSASNYSSTSFRGVRVNRTGGTGTVRFVLQQSTSTGSAGGTTNVQGTTASGATDSGNPITFAAVAHSTPRSFGAGQRAVAGADLAGNLEVTQATYLFGEDPRGKIAVEEQFSSTRITTATTTVCLVGVGTLRSVFIEVALTGTATIYDNTAASGTIITILPVGTVGSVPLPRKCALGCTVVTSAADRLVVFTA